MRWVLAGMSFALAVAMAIGTAAIRAENAIRRHAVEQAFRDVRNRKIELVRLSIEHLSEATSERLAEIHWRHLRAEAARRRGMQS
jgi:hypothetical protein